MVFQRSFDLDGVRLAVRGEGADLERVLDLLLGAYACTPGDAAPQLRLEFERRPTRPSPPDEPARFRFPPLGAWPTARGFRLVDDVADVEVIADGDDAGLRGWVSEDAPLPLLSRFAGLTVWVGLMECLRARGRYPLHGAALVAPDGSVVLLAGTKGAGKSTATLALAERGFRVVTDDTLFIERDAAGAPVLLGYKKRFHVRPDLLARRPDLAPLARPPAPFEPQDKLWLELEERFPGCTLPRCAAPQVILFPEIADAPHTRIVPIGAREALLGLMRESSFVFVRPELAAPHLAVLGALASGARAARLVAGRDLLADPAAYVDVAHGRWPATAEVADKEDRWASNASASS